MELVPTLDVQISVAVAAAVALYALAFLKARWRAARDRRAVEGSKRGPPPGERAPTEETP